MKCPKCGPISHINLKRTVLKAAEDYQGIAYVCPLCDSILSVGLDPLALNADLASQIASKIEDLELSLLPQIEAILKKKRQ